MHSTSQHYLSVLKKYDQRGPRYTSYPTAPYFQSDFGDQQWHDGLASLKGKDLSLYFHIPYCKSLCWYCGCNMQVNRKPQAMETYLNCLKQELIQTAKALPRVGLVKQIHFGGGSPNLLTPEQLSKVMALIHRYFPLAAEAEISLEADPRLLTEAFAEKLPALGFNRMSMGLQDFDSQVQKSINRVQPYELVLEKIELLNRVGIGDINVDVMYGLPHQTLESFFTTVQQVLSLSPTRIALFSYAHLPQLKRHMKLIKAEAIPNAQIKFQLFWLAKQTFQQAGYQFIGMDHFAKAHDPLAKAARDGGLHRNFQGYTTHAGLQMLGFGASSISFLNNCYAQNQSSASDYMHAMEQGLSPKARGVMLSLEDQKRAQVIQTLFCKNQIHIPEIEALTGTEFHEWLPKAENQIKTMLNDGLLRTSSEGWQVTELGQILLRNIAMIFDEYLGKASNGRKPTYSKTI